MPHGEYVELARPDFWIVCGIAIVLFRMTTSPALRDWLRVAINLAFLWLLIGATTAWVGGAAVLLWLVLHGMRYPWLRPRAVVLVSVTTLGLFLVQKLWQLATEVGLYSASLILSAIGFSYVALRVVELLRAVFERRAPPPDLPGLINYLFPFHMLAAGPIEAYDDFLAQPRVPDVITARQTLTAVERVARGLFKKYVLAYALEAVFLAGFTSQGAAYFVEAQVFPLWLFLDFSAYSDIAIGVGALMGVHTPENFNRPYIARNMIDFWERWHISLSQFIRRNIFIPIQLAAMRRTDGHRPLLCATLAFSVSFVLCGLWHEISLRFLLWGCLHALGLVVTNFYRHLLLSRLGRQGLNRYLASRSIRILAVVLTYEFVALSLLVAFG